MRWLKLVVYLALSYVVLVASLPRAGVWLRLAIGPAGWVPDPPNPFLWVALAVLTLTFVVMLVADVGLCAWRLPNSVCALMVVVFGVALVGLRAEERGRLTWRDSPFDAQPALRLSAVLDGLKEDLADHYRKNRAFPASAAKLEAMLAKEEGRAAFSPYLHSRLRRLPGRVLVHENATGPVLEIAEGVLPGTILYALSHDAQAYWLTAVAGIGAPAEPLLLSTRGGGPAVVSNLPARLR